MFDRVNLLEELSKEKNRSNTEEPNIIADVQKILDDLETADRRNIDKYFSRKDRIFTTEQIRKICVKYRLRFLNHDQFKGEIPQEAKDKMQKMEEDLGFRSGKIKIVAPSSLFKLEDKDSDPLLFMQLSKDRFFLIHKWGTDLVWHRALSSLIFRSLNHFIVFLILSAWVFAQLMPIGDMPGVGGHDGMFSIFRWYLFAFTLISFCSLSVLLLFTFRKNFSDLVWSNRYLS